MQQAPSKKAVAWHTVGIVADDGKGIGTGCAVRWQNHPLIVTAGHVIRDSRPDGLRFYFRDEGTMKTAPLKELWSQPDTRYRSKIQIEVKRLETSEEADLALLEVAEELETQHCVRFFELPADAVAPPVGTLALMRGYPSDLAKPVAPRILASFAVQQWGRVQDEPRPHHFDPDSEFLVKYVPAEEGKHAHGFSGAGVWFHQKPEGVWHPNLGLAGIVTHYYATSHLLSVLKVEFATRFLAQSFTLTGS